MHKRARKGIVTLEDVKVSWELWMRCSRNVV
jgi:hypothetical protein